MSALTQDRRIEQLRMPPQSVQAEQDVLGGLMMSSANLERLPLAADDFYRRDHQLIYRAICALDEANKPYDAVTVGEWFESQGLAEQVSGGAYLIELASTTASTANISAYAAIVKDKAVLRRVIEVGTGIVNDGFEPEGKDSAELLDLAIGSLMALQRQQHRHEFSLKEALKMAVHDMQEAFASGGALRGIPTGFSQIDRRLGGMHGGDLIFIGARPKMGKTALLVNMVHTAAKANIPVGVISGEQSALQLAQRFLALETSIAGERMRNGQIHDEEWPKLTEAMRRLLDKNVHIFDAGGPSIDTIRRMARKWKKEHGIRALYVDYLQRVKARAKDRVEEVGEVARGLKDIGRDLDIPVISLAQVKREVETRTDKRPTAADIANSDEATREADQIFMLYRDDVYNDETPDRGVAELNLEANRHGPTGTFRLAWMQESMRFADLEARDSFR